jgi:hypothetical protein
MIGAEFAFVVMALAVQMHQVEFIDQSLALEQVERPVDSAAIYGCIHSPRLAQNLAGIKMFGRSLDHAQNRLARSG